MVHASPSVLEEAGRGGSASACEYAPGAWDGCPEEWNDEGSFVYDVVDEMGALADVLFPVQSQGFVFAASPRPPGAERQQQ